MKSLKIKYLCDLMIYSQGGRPRIIIQTLCTEVFFENSCKPHFMGHKLNWVDFTTTTVTQVHWQLARMRKCLVITSFNALAKKLQVFNIFVEKNTCICQWWAPFDEGCKFYRSPTFLLTRTYVHCSSSMGSNESEMGFQLRLWQASTR